MSDLNWVLPQFKTIKIHQTHLFFHLSTGPRTDRDIGGSNQKIQVGLRSNGRFDGTFGITSKGCLGSWNSIPAPTLYIPSPLWTSTDIFSWFFHSHFQNCAQAFLWTILIWLTLGWVIDPYRTRTFWQFWWMPLLGWGALSVSFPFSHHHHYLWREPCLCDPGVWQGTKRSVFVKELTSQKESVLWHNVSAAPKPASPTPWTHAESGYISQSDWQFAGIVLLRSGQVECGQKW